MRRNNMRNWIIGFAAIFGLSAAAILTMATPAHGQLLGPRDGRLRARLAERLRQREGETTAVAGSPFGVGRINVQLPPDAGAGAGGSVLDQPQMTLTEANGRVFYAAAVARPVRMAVRETLGLPRPTVVYFLFTGARTARSDALRPDRR